ncbi:MAG: nickel pincer cofactor biosynthesis protein LarC [Candidatus Odinarchaeum yellowstonii]|uniref:Nickel pincer cofactor biosynthesis protein LarC n=1 Tax=Odinarchaeota yellowstonii (strain LCB_4) TaxID=1841599 RepID=A0AAF0D2C9_ODILC|nr:MAG: nickel pincer cofactor biosynthesis protein LarC [Candidatus Odinarchaeum yellowstonii]
MMNRNKILFIDSSLSGLSGDMLLSALIDMGFKEENLNTLHSTIKNEYTSPFFKGFKLSSTKRDGLTAKTMLVDIIEDHREIDVEEFKEIFYKCLEKTNLKEVYKDYASRVFEDLINAEKKIHRSDNSERLYLHELSSPDTVFDILGVSSGLQYFSILEEAEVYATPIPIGGGSVKFSHGAFNVPVPVVSELLRKHGIPFHFGPVKEELLTPTGIALIAGLKPSFQTIPGDLTIICEGYGAGNRVIEGFPNVLKMILFNKSDANSGNFLENDYVVVLETNLDDITGEKLSYAIEKIMEAGALDVSVTPTLMKKGRVGYIVKVLCTLEDERKIMENVFDYTNTLGLRRYVSLRYKLKREVNTVNLNIKGELYRVRVKEALTIKGLKRFKPEFEDLKKVSESVKLPLEEVLRLVRKEIERKLKKT